MISILDPVLFHAYNLGSGNAVEWQTVRRHFEGQTTEHFTMSLRATGTESGSDTKGLPVARFVGYARPVPGLPKERLFDISGRFSIQPRFPLDHAIDRLTRRDTRDLPHDRWRGGQMGGALHIRRAAQVARRCRADRGSEVCARRHRNVVPCVSSFCSPGVIASPNIR